MKPGFGQKVIWDFEKKVRILCFFVLPKRFLFFCQK